MKSTGMLLHRSTPCASPAPVYSAQVNPVRFTGPGSEAPALALPVLVWAALAHHRSTPHPQVLHRHKHCSCPRPGCHASIPPPWHPPLPPGPALVPPSGLPAQAPAWASSHLGLPIRRLPAQAHAWASHPPKPDRSPSSRLGLAEPRVRTASIACKRFAT